MGERSGSLSCFRTGLANENPSNGIDLWLKKTEDLIIDSFYKADLQEGKSYHDDHGQGVDCYRLITH